MFEEQAVLESLQIRIAEPCELKRCHQLLDEHHYCSALRVSAPSAASALQSGPKPRETLG